jgi:DNA-binding XRE family transcriptional regulator
MRKRFPRPGSLAQIFKNIRIDRGLSIDGLACRVQMKSRCVREIEAGSRFPSVKYCLGCASVFGANPSWVMCKLTDERIYRYGNRLRDRIS